MNLLALIFTTISNIILLPFKLIKGALKASSKTPQSSAKTEEAIQTIIEKNDQKTPQANEEKLKEFRVVKVKDYHEKGERQDFEINKVNYAGLDEKGQEDIQKVMADKMNVAIFEGKVEHAYELKQVKNSDTCPRCQSETQQYYANFIYATHVGPRVMFAPAGFFCNECPTVIIDHEMIAFSAAKQFTFQGVIGIDYNDSKNPDMFSTWNGNKAIYVFDENEMVLGIETLPTKSPLHSSPKIRNKKKKQMIKQSRKKNRRKN